MAGVASGEDVTDLIIERLRAACPSLRTVDEAWFASPIDDLDTEIPAAMPYLSSDDMTSNAETTRPVQQISQSYGLFIVAPRDVFKSVRKEIRQALFGYQVGQYHNPIQYGEGRQVDLKGQYIWWHETWTLTTHYRRSMNEN